MIITLLPRDENPHDHTGKRSNSDIYSDVMIPMLYFLSIVVKHTGSGFEVVHTVSRYKTRIIPKIDKPNALERPLLAAQLG